MNHIPTGILELVNFLIPASIFALMALALNVQWGHTGLFNAGVAAFFGLGAYAAAILTKDLTPPSIGYPGHLGGFEQNFALAAIVAMLLAAFVGLVIAIPILRLRADYFAISTLALAEIVRLVLTNARGLTGGSIGIHSIPRPWEVPGLRPPVDAQTSDLLMAGLVLILLLLTFLLIEFLTRAPWGRVLRGIREDEEATFALGKNVTSFRLQAFVLGCAFMGLAGAVFASYQRFIAPDQFDPLSTFTIYVMVILGGSANNIGVIVGAYLFYAFDFVSVRLDDALPLDWSLRFPYIRLMIIGALLVALVMYRPEGILTEKRRRYAPTR